MKKISLILAGMILMCGCEFGFLEYNWETSWESGLEWADVPKAEYEDCMEWALGGNWEGTPVSEVDTIFNKRHPGFWSVDPDDSPFIAFSRIGEEYMKELHPDAGSEHWIENQTGTLGEIQ